MVDHPLSSISAWVAYFSSCTPPVLSSTIRGLGELHEHEDDITGRDLSAVILHDPFMTTRVLHYLQTHKSKAQHSEVATIAHAVMMLGTTPFFKHFENIVSLESVLEGWPAAREGLLRVMSRSRHAALLAREWSFYRHDMASDEVFIAALLHDLAEMLLWASAPSLMLSVRMLQDRDRQLRSAEAQQQIFGFSLAELQRALAREWKLPTLLIDLMDESHQNLPRVKNVILAVDTARHLANGWDDAALNDDYEGVRRLLAISPAEVRESLLRASIQAAHEWGYYGVAPALALRPLSRY